MSVSRPLIFMVIDAPAAALGLTGPEKSVLVALISHLNQSRNGYLVWPSQQRLAAITGFGESTIRRVIRKLEQLELIKRQDSGARHNLYSVSREVIHSLCNTGQSERYYPSQNCVTGHSERSIPVRASGNTGQSERLTTKEQPNRTADSFSPFGCSANPIVSDGDHQRKLAVHGVVAEAVERMRPTRPEQPTVKNNTTTEGARRCVSSRR